MPEVYIALGSNLGDRAENLRRAREAITRDIAPVDRASLVYETEPWGPGPQGPYLNQAIRIRTEAEPTALLRQLLGIEQTLGRDRANEQRYGPRVIDLDILLYGGRTVNEPSLQIPHPRMLERAFVLTPLANIGAELRVGDVSVAEALAKLDASGVKPFGAE